MSEDDLFNALKRMSLQESVGILEEWYRDDLGPHLFPTSGRAPSEKHITLHNKFKDITGRDIYEALEYRTKKLNGNL